VNQDKRKYKDNPVDDGILLEAKRGTRTKQKGSQDADGDGDNDVTGVI
jgi:hypothetical protein